VLRISRVIILTRAEEATSSPHETFCISAIRVRLETLDSLHLSSLVKVCKVSQN